MKEKLLFFILLFSTALLVQAQKIYSGPNNGGWNTAGNWSPSGVPAAGDDVIFNTSVTVLVDVGPAAIRSLSVQGANTVTLQASGANRTITLTNGTPALSVPASATLIIDGNATGNRSMTIAFAAGGTAETASILGTLQVNATGADGTLNTANSTTTFGAGGRYVHNKDGGAIPTATWTTTAPFSTCEVTGVVGNSPSGLNAVNVGNLIWNCPAQTANEGPAVNISGDLTIINSGTGEMRPTDGSSHTVGRHYYHQGGNCRWTRNTAGSLTVSGNVEITGGTCNLSNGSAVGTLNVAGNFTHTAGTLTESGSSSGAVVFNGTGTPQVYTSGGTVSNTINFTVNTNAYLRAAAAATVIGNGSGGTFTLQTGATLAIRATDGIATTGAAGQVRVSGTRNFNAGANFVFDGSAAQNTGDGYPTALTGSLTVNNAAGVTITDAARTITTGTLNLTSGNFNTIPVATNRLSLGSTATINRSEGSMTGTLMGSGIYNLNYTGNSKSTGPEAANTGLNNLTVNLTSGQALVLNATASPDGNLTISGGGFNLSSNTINRSAAGGVLTVSNGATLTIGGTNTFPANYSTHSIGATSTVIYSGTDQTVSALNSSQNYGNLKISGSGEKTLAAATTVSGTLDLTSGKLNTATNILTLTNADPSLQIAGGSASSYVISTGAGRLKRNGINTGANAFPVGTSTYYLPVTVSPDVTSDFAVNVFTGITQDGTEGGAAMVDKTQVIDAVWNVDRSVGSGSADLTVYWDAALEGTTFTGFNNDAIGISRYSSWWQAATGDGDNVANWASRTISSFSPFGVGRAGFVLPITFASLKAYEKQQGVQIDWTVLTDKTVSRYEVERSADGRTFKSIGTVASRGSQVNSDYNFFDASPVSGTGFYRIRSLQLDGAATYSTILRVSLDKSNKEVVIYPNPVKGRILSLQAANLDKGNYTFKLYNANGQEMMKTSIKHDGGSINQTLNLPAGLIPGMYQVQLEDGKSSVMSKKIVVQQ